MSDLFLGILLGITLTMLVILLLIILGVKENPLPDPSHKCWDEYNKQNSYA